MQRTTNVNIANLNNDSMNNNVKVVNQNIMAANEVDTNSQIKRLSKDNTNNTWQSQSNFTQFNSLTYDPAYIQNECKENTNYSQHILGHVNVNNLDTCNNINSKSEPVKLDNKNYNHYLTPQVNIKDLLKNDKYLMDTRGYSTRAVMDPHYLQDTDLVNTDNALKRSCITDLGYKNQFTPNVSLSDHTNENNQNDNLNELTFGVPVQNKSYYRESNNYLESNENNDDIRRQEANHVPFLSVREKSSQTYDRLGLCNVELERGIEGCTVNQNTLHDTFVPCLKDELNNPNKLGAYGVYDNDESLHIPMNTYAYYSNLLHNNCPSKNAYNKEQESRTDITNKINNTLNAFNPEVRDELLKLENVLKFDCKQNKF